ncbi:MAG: MgtC/SapB family protein [Clostridium baratii]|uniref:MgtC family protein n=1 Tax=Clostridium baratii str. Sullivan TaxID=1415775 RepID=A0A0A7FW19_9CLOT|nr:MgtC/SapB family protein [Clostridium baratii]AIY83056.1 mgtC family protein [Clostridium baratii str. Sullivan]MBS6007012.1 MgtC/SapB family protein [Clostridium baratii]MDU4912406.1 MgtC/SapB family protein [Clostridium baratii]CUP54007.1 MgtC family protein [Clostridium baratii]
MNIYEVALRIVLAIVIGGVVGFNREYENRPAGFRTHVLVCLGATVAALIQVQLGYYVVNEIAKTPNLSGVLSVDIGRVICQVISGVGFLGAGTIIRTKASVKGLTTAASIWAVACVGIAVGMGFYTISILSGIGIVIALVLLKRFEYRFINKLDVIKFKIEYTDKAKVIKEINDTLEADEITIKNIEFINADDRRECIYTLLLPQTIKQNELISMIVMNEGIIRAEKIS